MAEQEPLSVVSIGEMPIQGFELFERVWTKPRSEPRDAGAARLVFELVVFYEREGDVAARGGDPVEVEAVDDELDASSRKPTMAMTTTNAATLANTRNLLLLMDFSLRVVRAPPVCARKLKYTMGLALVRAARRMPASTCGVELDVGPIAPGPAPSFDLSPAHHGVNSVQPRAMP